MRRISRKVAVLALGAGVLLVSALSLAQAPESADISQLLKPAVWNEVIQEREIMTHASLDDLKDDPKKKGVKKYSFYAAMLSHTGLAETRRILTDYKLYAKMIPYVSRADFSEKTRILEIAGGIWKFQLASSVRFEEKGERWISYRIVRGHFRGLEGNIHFQPHEKKGTAVYIDGALEGRDWPPRFVIERGAEIVFGFTARRMRSYLENPKERQIEAGGSKRDDDNEIPQPRSRL